MKKYFRLIIMTLVIITTVSFVGCSTTNSKYRIGIYPHTNPDWVGGKLIWISKSHTGI